MKGHTLTTITEKLSLLPNTLHLSKPEKITLIARETYNKVDYILTVDKKIGSEWLKMTNNKMVQGIWDELIDAFDNLTGLQYNMEKKN